MPLTKPHRHSAKLILYLRTLLTRLHFTSSILFAFLIDNTPSQKKKTITICKICVSKKSHKSLLPTPPHILLILNSKPKYTYMTISHPSSRSFAKLNFQGIIKIKKRTIGSHGKILWTFHCGQHMAARSYVGYAGKRSLQCIQAASSIDSSAGDYHQSSLTKEPR